MKKLLLITDMYPDENNPVSGIFVKHQVQELAKTFEIKVIATSSFKMGEFTISSESGNEYDTQYIHFPMNPHSYFLSIFHYFKDVMPEIRKVIDEWKPDIIHVHDCRHIPELFCLRHMLDTYNIPSYLTVHNNKTHPRKIRNPLSKMLYRFTLAGSYSNWTHIYTVNEQLGREIIPFIGRNRTSVVKNGILELMPSNSPVIASLQEKLIPERYRIISVGNLIREKGFDILLKAVRKLKDLKYDLQVVILGNGDEYHRLVQLSHDLGLDREVIFIPRQSNEVVRNIYPLFNCFVLPSYSETFGIVYLEAMYAGLPVIGIRGQGIDGTLIDGENGLLAEPMDVDSLTGKILYLLEHPDKADEMASAGQKLVKEQYILKHIIEKILSVYERK